MVCDQEKINITDYSIGDCTDETKPETPKSCFIVNENDPSEIIGYTCDSKIVTIPSEINGVEIKKIEDNAFKDKGLTEVIIPEGIISIGNSAFEGNHLTSVVIPGSVETIGDNAFKNNQLTEVIIGDGVKHIGNGAFEGNQLTNVTIPGSVETIGDNAFKDNQLTEVEIEEGVKNIGSGAFAGNDLTNVKIPDSVENIGEGAFDNNKGPIEIETNTKESCFTVNPDDPSEITGYVCEDKIISIPKEINGVEIKKIGDNVFKDKGITHVTIPEGIISIGNSAFEGNQLTNVKIPSTVTDIGENAFKNNQLTKVEVPDETNIGEGAFDGNDLSSTDQTKAEIKNVDIKTTSTMITVKVEAEAGKFGRIKEYEYSIDGGAYKKGTSTYTFENLEFESEHEMGIKVTTDSGLVTEKSVRATTEKGILSVTANGYTGTYDGNAHGITVTSSGATIKYGTTSGTYNLTSSPTYTNAGTYTVYYQVTRAGYNSVTGSRTIEISKADGVVLLSETSGIIANNKEEKAISIIKHQGGNLSCSSEKYQYVTCSITGPIDPSVPYNALIVKSTGANIIRDVTSTITVRSAATENYNAASTTYTVTVAKN